MEVEIKIDKNCKEPHVLIITDKITDEVTELVKKLSEDTPQMIVGVNDDKLTVIDQNDLIRIYANDGKVIAVTKGDEYILKLRLYEVEERLDKKTFVRISKSEIINLKMVKGFDLGITGTICVTMKNGITTYVSRRYVSKIKQVLGL